MLKNQIFTTIANILAPDNAFEMGNKVSDCLKPSSTVNTLSEINEVNIPTEKSSESSISSIFGNSIENSTLCILPSELIIEISSYLGAEDIESLSRTCKQLLSVIRECKKLTYKLPLKFTENFNPPDWINIEKYQKVEIFDGGFENYLKVHDKIVENIESLLIQCKEVKLQDLKNIISTFMYLEHLKLDIENLGTHEMVKSTENSSENFEDNIIFCPVSLACDKVTYYRQPHFAHLFYFYGDNFSKILIEIEKFTFIGHLTSTKMTFGYPKKYLMLYTKDMADENKASRFLIERLEFERRRFEGPDMSRFIEHAQSMEADDEDIRRCIQNRINKLEISRN